jgi:acetyltransferase-like isoleucine patch superfamily enzyme
MQILKSARIILESFVRILARHAPSNNLRVALYRSLGVQIGANTLIGGGTWIDCVYARGKVKIGNNVLISGHSILIAHDPWKSGEIVIEDGAWIGVSCTIIFPVRIGKNSIVGAGSVVTRNIPENTVAVGVPARVIKNRESRRISDVAERTRGLA